MASVAITLVSMQGYEYITAFMVDEEKRYGSDVLTKRFHGDTLGYVTPWNNHGYNTAKLFRSKFTYIAPVWYQIRHNDKRKPALTGGHDVDLEWMAAVRGDDTSGPQIVPRFMFEMNSLSPQEAERIISLIRSEVKDQRFDGITLEECYFRYPVKHIVYYPCLQSIQDRLDLYLSAQTGAAIWDIGQ
ncbi:hypothetical protein DYB28_009354, partial [Aphanomyces astaci]